MIVYGEDGQGAKRALGAGVFAGTRRGYGLGRAALRAITLAHDGCRATHRLTGPGAGRLESCPAHRHRGLAVRSDRQVAEIAALAPVVLAEAGSRRRGGSGYNGQAADALAEAVEAVTRRLGLDINQFPLVLAGRPLDRPISSTRSWLRRPCAGRVPLRPADAALMWMRPWGRPGWALATPGAPLESRRSTAGRRRGSLDVDVGAVQPAEPGPGPALDAGDGGLDAHRKTSRMLRRLWPTLPVIARVVDAIAERMWERPA